MAAVPSSSGSSTSVSSDTSMAQRQQQHGGNLSSSVTVQLEDHELWQIFSSDGIKNEMIITKAGRRMFPVVRVRTRGLDPRAMYNVVLEFVQNDEYKWKYTDGRWHKSGKAEPQPTLNAYVHPDSPNFGEKWMRDAISFSRLKFTNKDNAVGWVLLNSMHHYQPTVKIYRIDPNDRDAAQTLVASVGLPDCQFIAVTSYQNEDVTNLKIKHNPFAKGFQEHSRQTANGSNRHISPPYGGVNRLLTRSQQSSDAYLCPPSPFPPTTNAGTSRGSFNYDVMPPSPYADPLFYSHNDMRTNTKPRDAPQTINRVSNYRDMQPTFDFYHSLPPPEALTASFCPPPQPPRLNFSQYCAPLTTNNNALLPAKPCFPDFVNAAADYSVTSTVNLPRSTYDQSPFIPRYNNNVSQQQFPVASNFRMGHPVYAPPPLTTVNETPFFRGTTPENFLDGFDSFNRTINTLPRQHQQCLPFVGGKVAEYGNIEGVVGKQFCTSSVLQEVRNPATTTRYHPYGTAAASVRTRRIDNNNKHNNIAQQPQQNHQICAISQPQQHIGSGSAPGSLLFCVEKGSEDAARSNDIITTNSDANKILAASSAVLVRRDSTDAADGIAVHVTTCSQRSSTSTCDFEAA